MIAKGEEEVDNEDAKHGHDGRLSGELTDERKGESGL